MPSGAPRVALDLGPPPGGYTSTHKCPKHYEQADCSEAQTKREQEGESRLGLAVSLFAGGFGFGGSSLRCFGDFSATWQVACSPQECDKPSARQICGWRLQVSTHKCPKHYGQADCSEAQTQREQEGDDFAISFPFAASAAIS